MELRRNEMQCLEWAAPKIIQERFGGKEGHKIREREEKDRSTNISYSYRRDLEVVIILIAILIMIIIWYDKSDLGRKSLTTFSISSRSHWDVSLTISTSCRKGQTEECYFSIHVTDVPALCDAESSPSAWCQSLQDSGLCLLMRCSPYCSYEQYQMQTGLQ